MTSWTYLLQTMGWCAAGFLSGFLVGRTARDVNRIADAVTEGAAVIARPRRRIAFSGRIVIAVLVVALGIFTVVQGLIQSAATRRIANCHSAYANQFADALDARSLASQQAQDALDQLMTTIGRLAATPSTSEADTVQRREESRKAIADYVSKRAEAKAAQARNPFPKPPREACPS